MNFVTAINNDLPPNSYKKVIQKHPIQTALAAITLTGVMIASAIILPPISATISIFSTISITTYIAIRTIRHVSFDNFEDQLNGWVAKGEPSEKRAEAAEKIKEAFYKKATQLHLFSLGLKELPTVIGRLNSLTLLNLRDNNLTTLPAEIGNLIKLTELQIWKNQINQLPPEIGNLISLIKLQLWGNKLITLPPEIGKLKALIELNIGSNQLVSLPPEIGNLTALAQLDLAHNQLTSLPDEISNLTLIDLFLTANPWESPEQKGKQQESQLNSLYAWISDHSKIRMHWGEVNQQLENRAEAARRIAKAFHHQETSLDLSSLTLDNLPQAIGKLTALTQLDLKNNRLRELPEEIGNLTGLRRMDLSNNNLTELPSAFGKLQALTHLGLQSNRLIQLPREITKLTALTILDLRFNRFFQHPRNRLPSTTTVFFSDNSIITR